MTLLWSVRSFEDFSPAELYEVLALRQRVFCVEQNAAYLDCDGRDQKALHLVGLKGNLPVAYARLFDVNIAYEEASIGRVVTDGAHRRMGYGRVLMEKAIAEIQKRFGGPIRIGAQFYLFRFYSEFGFVQASEHYLEDGIDHIEMVLR